MNFAYATTPLLSIKQEFSNFSKSILHLKFISTAIGFFQVSCLIVDFISAVQYLFSQGNDL